MNFLIKKVKFTNKFFSVYDAWKYRILTQSRIQNMYNGRAFGDLNNKYIIIFKLGTY